MTRRVRKSSARVATRRGSAPGAPPTRPAAAPARPGAPIAAEAARYDATANGADGRLERWLATAAALGVVLVVAALLRLAHLLALHRTVVFDVLALDHLLYSDWAKRIVAGDWVGGDHAYFVDPLYAYFLAAIYAVFGIGNLWAVRLAQLLLGVTTCGLTAWLARLVTGSPAVATIAAALQALSIPAIFHEAGVEKTGLATFLSTLALCLFLSPSWRTTLAAGVVFGLTVLVRGNTLILLPPALLALGFGATELNTPSRRGEPRRRDWRRVVAFGGASALIIAVAVVRNVAVSGDVVITSNGGMNLYLGQLPRAPGAFISYPPFVHPSTEHELTDFRTEAVRRTNRDFTDSELSRYWMHEALAAIVADPDFFVRHTAEKLWLFASDHDVPDNDNPMVVAEYSPVLRLPVMRFGLLVALGTLGAVIARRRRRVRLLVVAIVVYAVATALFVPLSKLRLPLGPLLAVLAAVALSWMLALLRGRDWRKLAHGAALVVAVAVVTSITPLWVAEANRHATAIGFHNLGSLLEKHADADAAVAAYERAVAIQPEAVVASSRALGELYLRRGEWNRAEISMRRVLRLRPGSPNGREALVRLYEQMVRNDADSGAAGALRRKLATAYRDVGREHDAALVEQLDQP